MREPQDRDPLAERVRVSPDRVAVVRAADGEAWTYAALDDAVETTAGRLAALGVERGDHVGLLADTGVPAVRVIFATLRLGAVAVPLNARLTADELAPQLDRADLAALVAEPEFAAVASDAASEATQTASSDDQDLATSADELHLATTTDESASGLAPLADCDPAPVERADASAAVPGTDDLRLLLFTSGTTGEPKAVELTAGNLRASALASALRLGVAPDDRWFVPLAIYHMGGFAPVFRSVLYGSTAILQREFDPAATLAAVRRREATCLSVVPTMLRRLLDAAADGGGAGAAADSGGAGAGADGGDAGAAADGDTADAAGAGGDAADGGAPAADAGPLADLRFILSGGAATPPDLVDRCADLDVPLCPTYGVTEAASQVATVLPAEAREHEGTVGRPLLPVELSVVDQDGDPVPRGDPGELVVDGPTVSPGYYGDPDATAASRSERGYHTGDLGSRDEVGRVRVLGRVDDRIVTGGENVHAGAVADALREHPAVDDAVVLGLDDPAWGERVSALVAGDVAPAALGEHCDERLADFRRPKTIAVADELPRTASGTVDRDAARERLREDGVAV